MTNPHEVACKHDEAKDGEVHQVKGITRLSEANERSPREGTGRCAAADCQREDRGSPERCEQPIMKKEVRQVLARRQDGGSYYDDAHGDPPQPSFGTTARSTTQEGETSRHTDKELAEMRQRIELGRLQPEALVESRRMRKSRRSEHQVDDGNGDAGRPGQGTDGP